MNFDDYFEKYFIIEQISISRISEVMSVYNKEEKKIEIVKVLKNKPLRQLKKESKIATTLNHKNILRATSEQTLITDDGDLCKVLTYKRCDSDLFDYCNNPDIELTKADIYEIFRQMCLAVQYLHDNGMAHCDIKLENFLIERIEGEEKKVYLTDFEHLVDQKRRKTKKYKPATILYRSPETFKEKKRKIDAKAIDIWSLGISFHCMASTYLPFSCCEDDKAIKETIRKGKISIDEDLDEIEIDLLERMLDRNPKTRITISEILKHPIFTC
eukprot:TRINITY_DN359_c1_g1_i3.p1 TRINITY_DN359_c1_g1~~TRINITY_DN359_c1_g1_i3.p1  ORF type:complete len:271 (-),score=64.78 TRINITY_DN359_c1_g1_i3:107-919(-)